MVYLKWVGIGVGVLAIVAIAGLLIAQRISDGPMEFIQGGPFKTGALVDDKISDWSFAVGKKTEFELVGFGTSRTAGFVMLDGVAYMTCDLGYMWNRLEPGYGKSLLHLIYVFKHWHKDAVQDGRALLRVDDDNIYKTQLVRVRNPQLNARLRVEIEKMARDYFKTDLGPPPSEPPNDIWFFRMDPR